MKLTIKTQDSQKIIDLNKDLNLSAVKGEQYVFSNGFTNYTLNFKDDQQTVSLQFNVDGKIIKVDLKGIVPFLQENSTNTDNPTAIIINKSINEKNIENILQDETFNGSEIIDRLEALLVNPANLGKDLTLISDFQTLIEALDAAAAGGEQGGNNTNGSSFNSIFSPLEDSLNDIGETDIWENLSESISSIPVETGNNIGTVVEVNPIVNVNVKLLPVKTEVIEGENAIYKVTLTDDAQNPIVAIQDMEITFIYKYTTASGDDITELKSVIIPAGSSEITFEVGTVDDNVVEGTEFFTIEISNVSNQEQFDSVLIDNTPVETTITDEKVPTTPDDQTAIVSITGPANVIEGDITTPYTVSITQAPETDLTVSFTYSGKAVDGTDFTGVASVVIKAGEKTATFTIATIDDNLAEGAENFTVAINPSSLGAVGGLEDVRVSTVNNSVETTITDEKVPTTPDDQTAIVSITGPANVIEGDITTPYTVSITQAPETDLTVSFTYSGKAVDGTDFTGVASVVIKAGEKTATFTIATIDDNLAEGAENFTVAINPSSLGAVGGLEDVRVSTVNNSVETTITDEKVPTTPDDQTAIVSITGPANVIEGDITTPYTVSITQAPETDLTVSFTYSGKAVDGTDFTGVASVVIKAGEKTATFTIATIDDNLAEGAENFTVAINPSSLGAVGGLEDVRVSTVNNSVETTITDEKVPTTPDDQTAIVSITGPANVIEGDITTPYTVSITQAPETDLTVSFTYSGKAVDGTDFTGVASVVIKAGEKTATFTIATIDDNLAEGAENFTVAINPSSLGAVGGLEDVRVSTVNNSVETTITDNDIAPITVTVSEEGLANGIIDNSGVPIDTTNETKVEGHINVNNLTLSSNKEFLLNIPTITLTSNGDEIIWGLNSTNKELVGKVNGENAIKITVDNNGKYTVELLKPIDHAINSVEDVASFDVNITLKDGSFETEAKLTINIEDDMPSVEESTITWTQVTDIPDIFTGNVSFAGNGGDKSQYTFANGAVIVTGKGFANSTDLTLVDAKLNQDADGLGVSSVSSPYHNIANEVDFRKTADGQEASEELVIKLEDGKISYGAKIQFDAMYGKELEVGVAEFYRDGVLVSTQTFSSNATDGNYAANFEVLDGGFDTIIIKATDNGNGFDIKDNSDFTVSGIEFLGITSAQAISYAQGTIKYGFGADGTGIIGFTEVNDILKLADGSSVTITVLNNSIIAKDENENLVFQVQLTPSTGKWEFYKYQNFLIGDGSEEVLDINYRVVDADGDGVNSTIMIGVNKVPTTTDDTIEIDEDETYILTTDDFGTLSDNVTKVKITEIPTNGELLLNGSKVLVNQEINIGDISNGKLVFKPIDNTDNDSSFKFKVTDGALWSISDNITTIDIKAIADTPIASINVTKIIIDNSVITQLPNNISHVKYYLSDGTTLKIENYANPNTNPSDPTKYINAIESETGLKVIDYVIKAGTGVYSHSGVYLGNSIANGSNSDIFTNNADTTKTYTSINEVFIFGETTINKVLINTTNVKETGNGYTVEAYTLNGAKGELSEYKSSNVNGFGVKGSSSGNETEIGFKDGKSEEIRVKFDNQVTDVNVKFSWLHKGETALIKFYKDGIEVGSTTQKGLTDTIDGPFNFKPNNGLTFNEIRFMALGTEDDYLINSIEFNELIVNNSNNIEKEIYKIDLAAALKDTDGSETLTVKISGVPEGATFDLANITNLGNGVWEVIVPNGANSIDYKDIKMSVPSGTNYVDLTITARATETNDNANGDNYAESKASDATIYGINEAEQVNMKAFKYNLVLTIDNSGSMQGDKITLAKAAMVNLVNKYTELGEVKVLLNVFNSNGEIKGVWVSASEAIGMINAINTGGGTNYDDALLKNIDALTNNPAPLDGKTISYFVSDGVPTYGMYKSENNWYRDGDGRTTTDVNDTIVEQWKKLEIDKTYSIGVGTSQLNEYMREISQNPDEDVIIISNANQLSQILENTVQELLVEGNVLNNVLGGDGKISVENINFDGTIYTKDSFPQDGLLLEDNKIKFTFDFETGDYKYYAKSSKFVEEVKTFTVNSTDLNGDKDSFDVSVTVKVTQGKSENIQTLMGEDIDLSMVITKTTNVIDMENGITTDKLKIDLEDILDLNDKEVLIKGDFGDVVQLDKSTTDWVKEQNQQTIDGKNYNVYTNATVKLLINDDIDVVPDI